jgi:hypothetical protein
VAENRSKPDQFLLRLPPGLRDRIKRYAETKNRSLNEQIVRILEREFPEPFPLGMRITQLVEISEKLKEVIEGDQVDTLGLNIVEIIRGIAKGTVAGVDDDTRDHVSEWLDDWEQTLTKNLEGYQASFDEEELANYSRSGSTAKVIGPAPDEAAKKKPRKRK